jgi:predicted lipoprotein with Yx(FWY)xxD motif
VKTFGPRRTLIVASLAGVVAVAAGGGAAASAHVAGSRTSARSATIVGLRATSLGKVLVDVRGRTLYLYTPDGTGKSTCYGQCSAYWPPLLASGKPKAGPGVKASLLGVTARKDGKHQVTYAGHPLYRFVSDTRAGQANGEGLQDIWYAVSASGNKVAKSSSARATGSATIQLRQTGLGTILVDSHGKTLYLYTPDKNGRSACYGQCASLWPPLLAAGRLAAGKGLKSSLLGTTKRTDGKTQVTYNGHPLYTFAQDSKPGEIKGEDVQGIWYVVSAAGAKIEPGDDKGTTTTQEPGYGGGY